MSLSHILGTARKLGIPVVITNDRGESAQVVMPFEDFASMVSGASSHGHACECCSDQEADEDEEEEIEEIPDIEELDGWSSDDSNQNEYELTPKEIEALDKIIVDEEKVTNEPIMQSEESSPKKGREVVEPTSVSLEDQFYFEPIQDKE